MDQQGTPTSIGAPRGPYQYYEPPKRLDTARRSYAERSSEYGDGINDSGKSPPSINNPLGISGGLGEPFHSDPDDGSDSPNTTQQHLSRMADDTPPPNVRTRPWSPGVPSSPPSQQPSNRIDPAPAPRRDSVPEKSPLQKLEANLASKEQKRAQLESAEEHVRRRSSSGADHKRNGSVRLGKSGQEEGLDRIDDSAHDGTDIPHGTNGGTRLEAGPRPIRTSSAKQRPSTIIANDSRPYNRSTYAVKGILPTPTPTSPTVFVDNDAAARGKAAHERRKRQSGASFPQSTPIDGKFDKAVDGMALATPHPDRDDNSEAQHSQRQNRVSTSDGYTEAQPISRKQAAIVDQATPVKYAIPPQVASAQQAREQIGFGNTSNTPHTELQGGHKHHHLGSMFHRHDAERRVYKSQEPTLDEWRAGGIARLKAEDLEIKASKAAKTEKDTTWWEKEQHQSGVTPQPQSKTSDVPYEEKAKQYRPQLFTKCGPLLRYTGIRKESVGGGTNAGAQEEVEVWHGSVMMVTEDRQSDYEQGPTLRIFAQPMDLYVSTSQDGVSGRSREIQDPVAGQVKASRTGRPLYVRPVQDIASGVDLSREENPRGLYAATRTPMLGPQDNDGADGRHSQHITFQDKSRVKKHSGERTGQYREVKGYRLHQERGWTFWRFNIEIELSDQQARIAYRINKGPAIGFYVPARGQTMNIMFHSCNGFSLSVNPDDFSGPDPLWRDVLNRHQSHPFHVMIGGGDQIYNDAATRDTKLFREWLLIKSRDAKYGADFTVEMQEELEHFYLERYAMWFSQGLFAMANSQIPMVNIWDDHDIIDGFGSYPHHFMSSPVFTGVGSVAFKYYMLFQHQSLVAETTKEEPSWLLGASRGPYINELSRSVFLSLGRNVAFLGLDCRTERMRDEILSLETYQLVFSRCRQELTKGQTRHLIVLLGVPIAYPRLNFLENILTSRAMDPIKALGRTGMLGGFVNKFDGGVEVLDDLDDHWTAKHHKAERNWFIQELQELAAEYSVRITILGGDVHLAAIGQFFTPKKFGVPKDKDHRYMPNVISSAIVNTPPPSMMADVLNRRDKIHHLDHETDENLIPMFLTDVDGSSRNNKKLLPRRNYCTIREFVPGGTPPPSPRLGPADVDHNEDDTQRPPSSIKRTMSLTNNPATNLVRRFSSARRGKNPPLSLNRATTDPAPGILRRANSLDNPPPSALKSHPPESFEAVPPERRPSFHRRPTDLSEKQIRKASARGDAHHDDGREPGHVNLEYGLDVSLNMEIDQKDPHGSTAPYRILIPALWHDGAPDLNTLQLKSRRPGLIQRLTSTRNQHREHDEPEYSRSPSPDSFELERQASAAQTGVPRDSADLQPSRGLAVNNTRDGAAPRHHGAWKQGYDLAGPPMGERATHLDHDDDDRGGQVSPPQEPADYDDLRSLSPQSFVSGDDRDPAVQGPYGAARRPDKADRFFGVDTQGHQDGGRNGGATTASHGRHVSVQEEPTTILYDPPKRRASWKIWQR